MFVKRLNLNLDYGKHIEINEKKIKEIINYLISLNIENKYSPYNWDDNTYWISMNEDKKICSQFFCIGNSINFRYWEYIDGNFVYCKGIKNGIHASGANYMWRCLKISYEENKLDLFNSNNLSKITEQKLNKIFTDDFRTMLMPDIKERVRNLNDLGLKLNEYWGGEFYNLIKEAGKSLFNFIEYSRQFRAFDDPLCKLTMVNAIMHKGRNLVNFDESIFPAIDYQLMKINFRLGILIPKENIRNKIINRELLSKEEAREIRNACLKSFINIMEKTKISGDILDNLWWKNKNTCLDENPKCEDCRFSPICNKNKEYKIPLEITRYY